MATRPKLKVKNNGRWKPGQSGNPLGIGGVRYQPGVRGPGNGPPRKQPPPGALAHIRQLAALGWSEGSIAREACDMCDSTWRNWKADHPEYADAVQAGHDDLHNALVETLTKAAGKNFVPAMFLLKTRFGYRENDVPLPPQPNVTIVLPAPLSADQYAKVIEHGAPALPVPLHDD